MKLAIVLSHPTQYYSPWFRWLAQHTALKLRVFYLWNFGVTEQRDPQFQTAFKWDLDLLSGYEHEFVPNVAQRPGTEHFFGLRNPKLISQLGAWSPNAILMFGYNSPSHLRTLAWATRRRIPVLFRGDSHFLGRGVPSWRSRTILRILYSRFAAFLPVGRANTEYFTTLGVPASKLFFAPHAVYDRHFDPNLPNYAAAADSLRRQLGIARREQVVLFAGKLVPHKGPKQLLQAFSRAGVSSAHLVFVGDGGEKAELESIVQREQIARVHFLPFANQTEMPARYLLADLFVLPSRSHYETWGLAVNEAMHMGAPALVSDLVGCHADLVVPGETGWVFAAFDEAALSTTLR